MKTGMKARTENTRISSKNSAFLINFYHDTFDKQFGCDKVVNPAREPCQSLHTAAVIFISANSNASAMR